MLKRNDIVFETAINVEVYRIDGLNEIDIELSSHALHVPACSLGHAISFNG